MSTKRRTGRVRATYAFIKAHGEEYTTETMCRVLGVAPSGYYEWLMHPLSSCAVEDARLLRLMREADLRALHRYRVRRQSAGKPAILIPDLLQRQFTATRPNKVWVTDITYIRTWQGWLYLAVVLDLFSRKIVGWATSPTIHREVVLDAVLMAVRQRRPRGTLIHSDQGTQYGSDAWRRFCRSNRLEPSMSRKGNCWDNAVAESFFSSLKKERIKKQIYKNRELARADVAEYINTFYNATRRHSHLGGVSPDQFEAAHKPRRERLH